MSEIIRIGIDTSKSVFVLHGVDAAEQPVLRRKLRRRDRLRRFSPSCRRPGSGSRPAAPPIIGGANLQALGHEVKLLPAQRVKPYVARNKNDAADAEAICEAMSRPRMRFVPVKTAEQQAALMLVGPARPADAPPHPGEQHDPRLCGRVRPGRRQGARQDRAVVGAHCDDAGRCRISRTSCSALLGQEYAEVKVRLRRDRSQADGLARHNELSRRLAEVPAIGPIGACALAIKVTDPGAFRCGRDFAAWLGLTPKDHSTAGKQRLGAITRAGDETLRSVLVVGATAVIQQARRGRGKAPRRGSSISSSASRPSSPPWRSPTRPRASPGS